MKLETAYRKLSPFRKRWLIEIKNGEYDDSWCAEARHLDAREVVIRTYHVRGFAKCLNKLADRLDKYERGTSLIAQGSALLNGVEPE